MTESPDIIAADRYTRIRKYLVDAQAKGPLDPDTYLLAQCALILCDALDAVNAVQEEIRQLRVDLEVGAATRGKK